MTQHDAQRGAHERQEAQASAQAQARVEVWPDTAVVDRWAAFLAPPACPNHGLDLTARDQDHTRTEATQPYRTTQSAQQVARERDRADAYDLHARILAETMRHILEPRD